MPSASMVRAKGETFGYRLGGPIPHRPSCIRRGYGLAGSLTWSFAPTRRAMLAIQISSAPGFILHWALQGHWTAAGLNVLTMLLTLISAALDGPPDSRGVRVARSLYLAALLPVAAVT